MASSDIRHSRMTVRQVILGRSDDQAAALTQVEDFYKGKQKVLPGVFVNTDPYVFYQQYRVIRKELMWTTGMCFVAIALVSLVGISHPLAVSIVVGVVLLVFIDLLGCIPLSGVSLNSISMINMVMAIGFVVDYNMHIANSFMSQDPQLSRDERTVLAMKEIGLAVAKATFSTIVAILPLAFASSEVF